MSPLSHAGGPASWDGEAVPATLEGGFTPWGGSPLDGKGKGKDKIVDGGGGYGLDEPGSGAGSKPATDPGTGVGPGSGLHGGHRILVAAQTSEGGALGLLPDVVLQQILALFNGASFLGFAGANVWAMMLADASAQSLGRMGVVCTLRQTQRRPHLGLQCERVTWRAQPPFTDRPSEAPVFGAAIMSHARGLTGKGPGKSKSLGSVCLTGEYRSDFTPGQHMFDLNHHVYVFSADTGRWNLGVVDNDQDIDPLTGEAMGALGEAAPVKGFGSNQGHTFEDAEGRQCIVTFQWSVGGDVEVIVCCRATCFACLGSMP